MPSFKNWSKFILITLGFIVQIFFLYYFVMLSEIKKDWNQYRCNPVYLPFSDNIQDDFIYCIQSVQTNYMGYLLQPITYITSNLASLGGNLGNDINNIRGYISDLRNMITDIIQNVFGVFMNLIIEFQRSTIGIKDMVGKLIGIMVSLLYILDGSNKTMNSAWANPNIGGLVKKLSGGHCFLPSTSIKLLSGDTKQIKDILINDTLSDGSKVLCMMVIDNTIQQEPLYVVQNANNQDTTPIYVTGTHYIFDSINTQTFIQVKDHPDATAQTAITTDVYYCLITNTHHIPIGNYVFWDWESYLLFI